MSNGGMSDGGKHGGGQTHGGNSEVDLDALPRLPRAAGGPVFRAPWEAQAFALTLALHARGLFDWTEWAQALSQEIRGAQAAGDPDIGDTYYQHWLAALERLALAKGWATPEALQRLAGAWQAAARATPHGQPVVLAAEGQPGWRAAR